TREERARFGGGRAPATSPPSAHLLAHPACGTSASGLSRADSGGIRRRSKGVLRMWQKWRVVLVLLLGVVAGVFLGRFTGSPGPRKEKPVAAVRPSAQAPAVQPSPVPAGPQTIYR